MRRLLPLLGLVATPVFAGEHSATAGVLGLEASQVQGTLYFAGGVLLLVAVIVPITRRLIAAAHRPVHTGRLPSREAQRTFARYTGEERARIVRRYAPEGADAKAMTDDPVMFYLLMTTLDTTRSSSLPPDSSPSRYDHPEDSPGSSTSHADDHSTIGDSSPTMDTGACDSCDAGSGD